MGKTSDFFSKGNVIPLALLASAVLGFMAVASFLLLPEALPPVADMRIEPLSKTVALGETFPVDIVVESSVPVNVFAGELFFNHDTLEVESIDYNTSIADLWAEKPWYSNGAGTLNFIGGTTHKGGFIGTEKLITVTFKAKSKGDGTLYIHNAQILQHDGLGTDAALAKPIDALFTVAPDTMSTTSAGTNLLSKEAYGSTYQVVPMLPSTDLNSDGKQNIADASILLLNMGSKNMRYDLNQDGVVDLSDLNVLMQAQ